MEKIKISSALTCKETDSIIEVAKLLKKEKERRVFVVDANKKLTGIVTCTDLVYKALASKKFDIKVKDVMTQKVQGLDQSEPLENALGVMSSVKSFVCPITDKGKFLGVLHHHDIISFLTSQKK
jgi:CBS domain-containing protein